MAKPLPPAGRAYLAVIIPLGALAIYLSAVELWRHPVHPAWLLLLALTSFSSTFATKIPNINATVSVSETFVFICALMFGPAPATLIIAIDGLVISTWRRYSRPVQVVFNATQPALSMFIAANVFFWMAGIEPGEPVRLQQHLAALVTFTSFYFVLNSGLSATIVSIQTRTSLWTIWTQHFGWVLLNYFAAASVAALLVHNTDASDGFNVRDFVTLGIVAPLIVVSYLTFKTSLKRIEDANRHLEEMDKLHLSTIETLAMAVDAKDQITHNHIRRVQTYARRLAHELGIKDDTQLKAIEAAALLHDMGKLAIPEHILNKPGKLSPAEFEKMKKHASIGADILSFIEFPYPVVPIVRHHHERWDGKGYPDGIVGGEIPIGARILAVVDCFDALTSDRPYRRALSDEQAMALLQADRGKAYDPLIVDTFRRVYRDIAPQEADLEPHRRRMAEIAAVVLDDDAGAAPAAEATPATGLAAPVPPALGHAAETEAQVLPILESLHSFSAQTMLGEAADDIGAHLCKLTPASLCVLYTHDVATGDLVLTHAHGAGADGMRGVRMAVGERLSGWVAANRQTICNSDAALDLAMIEPPLPVSFQSCLSTPLVAGDALVGVLSLYAQSGQAFDDAHRRLVERTSGPLGHLVKGALELETVQHVTEAGAQAQLPLVDLRGSRAPSEEVCTCPVAAVALQIWGLEPADGAGFPNLLLARAAAVLRRDLRVADLLYRDGPTGLVAVLPHAAGEAANAIAKRARTSLVTALSGLGSDLAAHVTVTTGVAWTPDDGLLLDDVMDAARVRAGADDERAVERGVRTDVA
jgi:putative nucleotidyltransferase with HDIG domain